MQIESLTVTFHGHDLIVDSELELNYGRFVVDASFEYERIKIGLIFLYVYMKLLYFFLLFRRYGLLGLNGCGKSTLLTAIGCRELPIPDHMDIYHLSREIEASDMSSLEAVISCDEERIRLEKEVEELAAQVS